MHPNSCSSTPQTCSPVLNIWWESTVFLSSTRARLCMESRKQVLGCTWLMPSFKSSLMRLHYFFPVMMPSSLVELILVSLETPRSWFPHRPRLLRYNRELLHRALDRSSCHHHGLQDPLPAGAGRSPAQGGAGASLKELHHPHQPAARHRVRGQHHRRQRQGGEPALGWPANNRWALRECWVWGVL